MLSIDVACTVARITIVKGSFDASVCFVVKLMSYYQCTCVSCCRKACVHVSVELCTCSYDALPQS